eukprot:CAMPEP_0185481652 /NCGR_PEP_ID=MMETSP1366-20130426/7190_1 /TAXON_ID=38817 /ORGANISM="Gephyrocapsa oceanica, Strain RCC1303" /LENGTH=255 /DNA_ID=CAMNT_0028089379 /DNA_START=551 /DNA_END=1315 /DNA_ORIENTATION=+
MDAVEQSLVTEGLEIEQQHTSVEALPHNVAVVPTHSARCGRRVSCKLCRSAPRGSSARQLPEGRGDLPLPASGGAPVVCTRGLSGPRAEGSAGRRPLQRWLSGWRGGKCRCRDRVLGGCRSAVADDLRRVCTRCPSQGAAHTVALLPRGARRRGSESAPTCVRPQAQSRRGTACLTPAADPQVCSRQLTHSAARAAPSKAAGGQGEVPPPRASCRRACRRAAGRGRQTLMAATLPNELSRGAAAEAVRELRLERL